MTLTDVVPNLIVSDIDRSTTFYRDVLGFTIVTTVPEQAPFVFVWLQRDGVSVFLNAKTGVEGDVPELVARPVGGTATLFITVEAATTAEGVDSLMAAIGPKAKVVMPLKDQFYGMREFGVEDPDGYVIFFAQRTA
jgi:catechol 2,3-dioxygenase-like lactoylglutathione lyase family enzyme